MTTSLIIYIVVLALTNVAFWMWLHVYCSYDSTIPYDPQQLPRLQKKTKRGAWICIGIQVLEFAGYHLLK